MAFTLPSEDTKYTTQQAYFRGVDKTSSPGVLDVSRAADAPNMIRDEVGKVRKRMGFQTVANAPNGGRINGVFQLEEKKLVHAGAVLYLWENETFTALCTEMNNEKSTAFRFDDKLYLLDGEKYRVFDGETAELVEDGAYVPTVIISRSPTGGGKAYEPLNLIGREWREDFLTTEEEKWNFQLTTDELDDTPVRVEVMTSDGEWAEWAENDKFTVNRTTGVVHMASSIGTPPVAGMDNVRIYASKTRQEYLDKINKCRVTCLYGVGGAQDRVFLSGNPEQSGYDWYSAFEDPTYFPDTGYNRISRDGSAIVGYAILGNNLATFIKDAPDGRNILVRQGSLDSSGEAVFRTTNTIIGESAIAPRTLAYLGKEPLFLTRKGVYAITAEELTGEKYAQERSYYLHTELQKLETPEEESAICWRDFYILTAGDKLYLLDGQQKSYERNNPYSSFQYEAYYFTKIQARCLWVDGDALCFGREDGTLCAFGTSVDNPAVYNDDGNAIEAYWETGDYTGKVMFRNKTVTAISTVLAAAVLTGVKVYAQKKGIWAICYDSKDKARYFDWGYIDFAKFVFSSDRTPHTLTGKVKLKKVDKVRFRLFNGEKNEPFGLYAFGLEWKEPGGNYKR